MWVNGRIVPRIGVKHWIDGRNAIIVPNARISVGVQVRAHGKRGVREKRRESWMMKSVVDNVAGRDLGTRLLCCSLRTRRKKQSVGVRWGVLGRQAPSLWLLGLGGDDQVDLGSTWCCSVRIWAVGWAGLRCLHRDACGGPALLLMWDFYCWLIRLCVSIDIGKGLFHFSQQGPQALWGLTICVNIGGI